MIAHLSTTVVTGVTYLLVQTVLSCGLDDLLGTRRDGLLAASKLTGGFHALVVGASALRVITDRKWQHLDLVNTPSSLGDQVVAWELGYLLGGGYCFFALLIARYRLLDTQPADPEQCSVLPPGRRPSCHTRSVARDVSARG